MHRRQMIVSRAIVQYSDLDSAFTISPSLGETSDGTSLSLTNNSGSAKVCFCFFCHFTQQSHDIKLLQVLV